MVVGIPAAISRVIFNPDEAPQSKFVMRAVKAAARSLNVQVIASPIWTTARCVVAHRGIKPRFMSQPELPHAAPLQIEHPHADYSPVEIGIRLGPGLHP
jgi:hypothetical protein